VEGGGWRQVAGGWWLVAGGWWLEGGGRRREEVERQPINVKRIGRPVVVILGLLQNQLWVLLRVYFDDPELPPIQPIRNSERFVRNPKNYGKFF
jgi:hypothetical protein